MPLLVLLPWEQDPESLSRLSLCPGNGDSIFKDHLLQCILCMSRRVGLYTPPRPWHLEALNWFGRGRSCDGQASKARSATGGSELPSLQWSPEKTPASRAEVQAGATGSSAGWMAHACHPSAWEAEAGESGVRDCMLALPLQHS